MSATRSTTPSHNGFDGVNGYDDNMKLIDF
jgi:hypothetical protein